MLTYRTFYIAASIFVLAAGLINALVYDQHLIGFGFAAWGFVMLLLTPARKDSEPTPMPGGIPARDIRRSTMMADKLTISNLMEIQDVDRAIEQARRANQARIARHKSVALPIEWEAAMADDAPPLDTAFLEAAKRK